MMWSWLPVGEGQLPDRHWPLDHVIMYHLPVCRLGSAAWLELNFSGWLDRKFLRGGCRGLPFIRRLLIRLGSVCTMRFYDHISTNFDLVYLALFLRMPEL